ncbi:hypothetical protein [Candidatus Liberibacter sp.]|uniref:hypothetical protein n=1 Tax=Candidatus Liberibacter sp. TaxID=34022 RepID=UPI0015F41470|nr:hypothetical protein [Candidatus Liberibacter sp.]MBA5724270.1 hypothetical protein [Candidatus Liberibacter sp.]
MNKKRIIEAIIYRPILSSIMYATATIIFMIICASSHQPDYYLTNDTDSTMRIVQVRDWLSGQNWFDTHQYRLGLNGGILMHWSRFIDALIGGLILLFSLCTQQQEQAENIAIMVYPLILIIPLMFAMTFAGKRISGVYGMHLAPILTLAYLGLIPHFSPGYIDHHNLQLVLTAIIAAMFVDQTWKPLSFFIAGIAVTTSIVIGAETIPFIISAYGIVFLLWITKGEKFSPAARAFTLSLTIFLTLSFVCFISPKEYTSITCDNFSFGIYSLLMISNVGLFTATILARKNISSRIMATIILVSVILIAGFVIAPQCIGNPMSSHDPMLKKLWLDHVSEAQSFTDVARNTPASIFLFFMPGLAGILVCLYRIIKRDNLTLHSILLMLILPNWAISLIEIRQYPFVNILVPLAFFPLIKALRTKSIQNPQERIGKISYAIALSASTPMFWVVIYMILQYFIEHPNVSKFNNDVDCVYSTKSSLERLGKLSNGVVSASSNMGPFILRLTKHRVISGPYHRNQAGMLAQLHIALSSPNEAKRLLESTGVTILAICPDDPEVRMLQKTNPEGLYAKILKNDLPSYIEEFPGNENQNVKLYRFIH